MTTHNPSQVQIVYDGNISQPISDLPESGTYTTEEDIDLEIDHIYFEKGNIKADPAKVILTYQDSDGKEFAVDATTAVEEEICEDENGNPYTITNVELTN